MESNEKKIKVLVSTKDDKLKLSNYIEIDAQFDWNVVKLLMKHSSSSIKDDNFGVYLQNLKYVDEAENSRKIDTNSCWTIDDDAFINCDLYIRIISDESKSNEFLNKFKQTGFVQKRFLQNREGTVFIVPTLENDFCDDNIKYVESLIAWLKFNSESEADGNGTDCYLLLHDKDLLPNDRPNSKVSFEDIKDIKDIKGSLSETFKKLVDSGHVFVFQHDETIDYYYNHIVKKLNDLTPKEIVELLNGVKENINLSEKLINIMKKMDMNKLISSEKETYDFSKQFLEL